ncbi:MAG: hypothetical protein IT381_24585 [Deltaproteobacteria bacterium]|nr:hypothetical protein [Deltaproteobacteria bacterium]
MHGLLLILAIAADRPKTTAAMALTAKGVDATTASAFDELVVQALGDADIGKVIAPSDIRALLDLSESQRLAGCDTTKCIAEISAALGVQYIVSGSLVKVGADLLLSLARIDTRTSEVLARAQRRVAPGGDYATAVAEAVGDLVGKKLEAVRTVGPASAPRVEAPPRVVPPAIVRTNVPPPVALTPEQRDQLEAQQRERQAKGNARRAEQTRSQYISGTVLGVSGVALALTGALLIALRPTFQSISGREYAALGDARTPAQVAAAEQALASAIFANKTNPLSGSVLIGIGSAFALTSVILFASAPRVKPTLSVTTNGAALGLEGALW